MTCRTQAGPIPCSPQARAACPDPKCTEACRHERAKAAESVCSMCGQTPCDQDCPERYENMFPPGGWPEPDDAPLKPTMFTARMPGRR